MTAFLTVPEAAEYLRVSHRFIRRLASQGVIPAVKVGHWRIDRRGFLRWVRKQRPGKWRTYTVADVPGTSDFSSRAGQQGTELTPARRPHNGRGSGPGVFRRRGDR